jgi:hypothetical protein
VPNDLVSSRQRDGKSFGRLGRPSHRQWRRQVGGSLFAGETNELPEQAVGLAQLEAQAAP